MLRNCGRYWIALVLAAASPALADPHARPQNGSPPRRTDLAERLLPAYADAGEASSVPFGWIDFCRRYVSECGTEPLPTVQLNLSSKQWQEIAQINRSVNAAIQPLNDRDHWGVEDQWDYPTDGKGDCEDYALFKRKLMLKAGYPRQALLMTVVRDEYGEGHAVLTLVTGQGDYVLDNKTDAIRLWSAIGYQFIKRQSSEDPNVWLMLRGKDVPSVATTR
jgi:predicted transglutaminase-like cysteine proteinase